MSLEYVHFCLQPYALFLLAITLHIIYLLHLLSTNRKCTQPSIFPCYSNLLLRRRRWTRILRWGVLGYASPQLSFLWCYGVFRYSVSPRVALVFKDINYVIIILYIYDIWLSMSTFGRMCGTIDLGSCIRWVLSFGIKNRVWQLARIFNGLYEPFIIYLVECLFISYVVCDIVRIVAHCLS
jgi:hypothetical protein